MIEEFLSLRSFTRYKEKIKRSIFIGSAEVVFSESEAKRFIKGISNEFKNATHNCWAYKVGEKTAYSDAGEPSGTAGRPIIGAIEKLKLNNVAVVVTRFYGGVKLGVRGLIDAYSNVALKTLESGDIVSYISSYKVTLRMEYPVFDRFVKFASKFEFDFNVKEFEFTDMIKGSIYIPEKFLDKFKSMVLDLKKYGIIEYNLDGRMYIPEKMEV